MSHVLQRVVVGEPFLPGVCYGGVDRFEYHYDGGTHLLQCLLPRISEAEVHAFNTGAVHVGLYAYQRSIFFLFKIDGVYAWSDQAFALAMLPSARRSVPPCKPGEHLVLSIVLVESTTGIVRGIRVVTYSPHMSSTFTQLLRAQLDQGLTAEQHQRNVEQVYRAFPSSAALVRTAVTERAGVRQP
ncbi:hypothetical protein [Rubrivivax gelatinosus]|uniref:hypothetical protein n=1 Tax=Rubrivivax gelatinosus TaxID=28068 RepID=UPI0005C1A041|nr:hypothetical protein [Rubrivivax gelatinosus]MBG6083020.1 hypothetical protein [Rubrivivax gelatinosus]